jgi:hypothetical protein
MLLLPGCGLVGVGFTDAAAFQYWATVFPGHTHAAKSVGTLSAGTVSSYIYHHAYFESVWRPADPAQTNGGAKLNLPFYNITILICHVQEQKGMRISKNEAGDRSLELDAVLWIIERRTGMMRKNGRADGYH